jgi:hypothetical protein
MAKANFKTLLIDKGERYVLIAAGGAMLLFALLGVMNMSSGTDPNAIVNDLTNVASKQTTALNSPDPKDVSPPPALTPPKTNDFKSPSKDKLWFDPVAPPDKGRINPRVLKIAEIQANFLHAKVKAYDIRESGDGSKQIAVLPGQGKDKIDADVAKQFVTEATQRFAIAASPLRKGPGAPPAAEIQAGPRDEVEYVPLDPERLKDKRFALTIYPRRMVIIQASFPYKEQIKEIKEALRLENANEVFDVYKPEETPRFLGVLLQRQVRYPDGKIESDWADLDVEARYRTSIFPRKVENKPEEPGVPYVLLPSGSGHRFTMPLPALLSGSYPEIRLPTIVDTIKKLAALNRPPEKSQAPSAFRGEGDIFDQGKPSQAAALGQPNLEAPKFPMGAGPEKPEGGEVKFDDLADYMLIRMIDDDIVPGRLYRYRMKVLMLNPNWEGLKDKKGVAASAAKRDLVSKPSDINVMVLGADINDKDAVKARFALGKDEDPTSVSMKWPRIPEEDLNKSFGLKTEWTELKETEAVSVPREDFLFGADSPLDSKGKPTIPLKTGQGILQVQRWKEFAIVDRFTEPVADWMVAEIVATRGTYLGGKTLVNLPIWSSKVNKYVLRISDVVKGKLTTTARGITIDPTKPGPQYVVVDVEGGPLRSRPLTRTTLVDDDIATEVLLLDEGGALQLRSSFADRPDAGRAEREKNWNAWIGKTEQAVPDSGGPKPKNFD